MRPVALVSPPARRSRRRTTMLAALALAASAALVGLSTEAANASIPGAGTSGVSVLCTSTAFACTYGGYNGTAAQENGHGWTSGTYWAYGRAVSSTVRHNCTTYVQFRLMKAGVAYPGWHANASGWDTGAANAGTKVNHTPAVGSVAQWNAGSGHVAWVEQVTSTYIITTSDNYSSGTNRLEIKKGSPGWPDNFIHFKDAAPLEGNVLTASGYNYRSTDGVLHVGVRVTGWAFDLASFTGHVTVRIGVGSAWQSGAGNSDTVVASSTNTSVPGLSGVYRIGTDHGFSVDFDVAARGTQTVYIDMVSLSGATTKSLGTKTVTIPGVTVQSAPVDPSDAAPDRGNVNADGTSDDTPVEAPDDIPVDTSGD